jgi:hypothetical protein
MILINSHAITEAHAKAMAAVMNACPTANEQQAEALIQSMAELVFITIMTFLEYADANNH